MLTKMRAISFIIIMVLIVTACAREERQPSENDLAAYNKETDDQPFWDAMKKAASTKYGYYFMINNRMYLYDPESRELIPLCGRADCGHKGTTDCNACFDGFIEYVGYYNECLYMVGGEDGKRELNLYQVTADGSQRTKLCRLGLIDADCDSYSFMAAVHRGYFYYSILPFQTTPVERSAVASRISLTDDRYEKEEIYRREGLGAAIYGFWAYDNTVLFNSWVYTDAETLQTESFFSYYDTVKNKVVDNIISGEENTDVLYASGDNIYFCKDGDFFSVSVKDSSQKEYDTDIFENGIPTISYDFNDLYCMEEDRRTVHVYDTKEFVKKKDITLEKSWEMLFGDEKFLFAVDYNNTCLRVYDKSQDGSWESVDYGRWE